MGDALGTTVVKAMRAHGLATAFCISTDAAGVCVQPIYSHEKGSQPCKKGHFLVMIADRDLIVFQYLEKENGAAIYERFRGFAGHDGCERTEVGCWCHCRRRFWEAAVAKCQVAREGLVRLGRIFELDASWKDKPPSDIKRLRAQYLRPHVDSFFAWVDEQLLVFDNQRGYTRSALKYASNQRDVLTRFFDHGTSRAHQQWRGARHQVHRPGAQGMALLRQRRPRQELDPEEYLRCLIRLVPLWPEDRTLELTPLFWARTRDRLDPTQLAAELGPIAIPSEPLDTMAPVEQQAMAG